VEPAGAGGAAGRDLQDRCHVSRQWLMPLLYS
jgi:hypothetical protein